MESHKKIQQLLDTAASIGIDDHKIKEIAENQTGETISDDLFNKYTTLAKKGVYDFVQNDCQSVIPEKLTDEEEKQYGENFKKILVEEKIPNENHDAVILLQINNINRMLKNLKQLTVDNYDEMIKETATNATEYNKQLEIFGIAGEKAIQIGTRLVTEDITKKCLALQSQKILEISLKKAGNYDSFKNFMLDLDSDTDEDIEECEINLDEIERVSPKLRNSQ